MIPTHFLFVDGIIFFLLGYERERMNSNMIIDLYTSATRMEINQVKSTIYCYGRVEESTSMLEGIFYFQALILEEGFKYLGFFLKPNKYGKGDWHWLIAKIENHINFWCNRWISRGGRLVLVNFFLEAIPFYWQTLTYP